MELSYKQRVTKGFVYMVLVAFAVLLQNTAGLLFEIGPARCLLVIPVCIILGLGEDEKTAALLGLFGGLLWDLSSPAHLGFNAIFLCITCYITSALVVYIVRNTFITSIIFTTLTIVLYCFLYWLCFVIIKNVVGAELTLFTFYIPSAIYTCVVALIVRICLRPIQKKLNKE